MMVMTVPLKNILGGAVPNESSISIRNDSKGRSVSSTSRGRLTSTLVDAGATGLKRRVRVGGMK